MSLCVFLCMRVQVGIYAFIVPVKYYHLYAGMSKNFYETFLIYIYYHINFTNKIL